MRRALVLLAVATLAVLLAPSAFSALSAPHAASVPSRDPAMTPRAAAIAGRGAAAPTGAVGTTDPAFESCPTPSSSGIWGSTDSNGQVDFYKSVKVEFDVPNDPGISGTNFNTTPCGNTIPTYTDGFWMNISTDIQIESAVVEIWGVGWSTPQQQYETPIPNYSPGPPYNSVYPNNVSMYVNPPLFETASFYFNDYKNFWPGSQVFFNLTVYALNATPAFIRSSDTGNPEINPAGTNDVPSWQFLVQSPWTSNNFSQDVAVSTVPSVLTTPAFDPNPDQALQILLSAINVGTGTTLSIPEARLTLSVCTAECGNASAVASTYQADFGPANHSTEEIVDTNGLPRTLGPFSAGSQISFNITAWVPWEGGAIDYIYSPFYNFTWSSKGGWWAPNEPLEDNLQLSTNPTGLNSTPQGFQTDTPVNVTIHEPIQNVTIASASVVFQYHDKYGTYSGAVPMIALDDNTSYLNIPGLPPGGNLTFSVLAKDIKGDVVASANYSYYEDGSLAVPPSAGTGYLFFEAVDLSSGTFAANAPYTITNSSWSESGNVSPFGFGGVKPLAGLGYLPLSYGTYTLTVKVDGVNRVAVITVAQSAADPTVFYYASQPVPTLGSVASATFSMAGAVGILAAAVVGAPLFLWFQERRRKAEAEQKRITL